MTNSSSASEVQLRSEKSQSSGRNGNEKEGEGEGEKVALLVSEKERDSISSLRWTPGRPSQSVSVKSKECQLFRMTTHHTQVSVCV